MNRKILVSILVVLVLATSVTLQAFAQPQEDVAAPPVDEMLDLVNEFRTEEGKDRLELSAALCDAAHERASEMAREGEISHTRPDGDIFDTSFEASGDKGENVFRGGPLATEQVPASAFTAWKEKSTLHRQNMLDSAWGYMGVGYVPGNDGYWYVCQLFSQTRPNADDEGQESASPTEEPSSEPEETEDPEPEPSAAEPSATPEPSWDSSRTLQRIEAPDEVVAGETINFKVITTTSANLYYYHARWSHPSQYKSDVSRDLRTLSLYTKTADDITVEFAILRGNQTERVSKTVHVRNAVHAEIKGPDQVAPGRRTTVELDTIEGVGPQDISWSVIPGVCALDFSADKRRCTFVSPSDADILFIAKVKLKGSVATAKKTVKVASQIPVKLEALSAGRVGYELEVHVDVDHRVRPGDIYWSMYPGTCDAFFAPDNRTMYFTPTSTDTLEITVRAEYEGKSGAAFLVVPVAGAGTLTSSPTSSPTTAETVVPSSGPIVTEGDLTPATSAAATDSSGDDEPFAQPSSDPTEAPQPTSAGSSAESAPSATPASVPDDPASAEPTSAEDTWWSLDQGATTSPTRIPDLIEPHARPTLPFLPVDSPTQTPITTPGPTPAPPAPTATTTARPDEVQHFVSGDAIITPPDEKPDKSSASPSPVSEPAEPLQTALQLRQNAPISLQRTEDGQTAVADLELGLTVGDMAASFAASDTNVLRVVDADGQSVPLDAHPATGQMIQVRNSDGRIIDSVPVIVPGDVLGTGKMSMAQLVRAASALIGDEPLTGVYLRAVKMTGPNPDGDVSLSDIVCMARLLNDVR